MKFSRESSLGISLVNVALTLSSQSASQSALQVIDSSFSPLIYAPSD